MLLLACKVSAVYCCSISPPPWAMVFRGDKFLQSWFVVWEQTG